MFSNKIYLINENHFHTIRPEFLLRYLTSSANSVKIIQKYFQSDFCCEIRQKVAFRVKTYMEISKITTVKCET